jgi:hypothetical protein
MYINKINVHTFVHDSAARIASRYLQRYLTSNAYHYGNYHLGPRPDAL